jgi:hypothetical protein
MPDPLLHPSYRCPVSRNRGIISAATLVTIAALLLLAPGLAVGQSAGPAATSAAKSWTPARTPDGQPDLQGVWTNNSVTPLERPQNLAGKEFYTEAELAAIQKRDEARLALNETNGLPPANHSGVEGAPAEEVHYDFAQFGLDREQAKVAWNLRTSIVVGPEGRIPPLTPEAHKRIAERAAREKGHEFDGPENRPLGARCIARPNVGPAPTPQRL